MLSSSVLATPLWSRSAPLRQLNRRLLLVQRTCSNNTQHSRVIIANDIKQVAEHIANHATGTEVHKLLKWIIALRKNPTKIVKDTKLPKNLPKDFAWLHQWLHRMITAQHPTRASSSSSLSVAIDTSFEASSSSAAASSPVSMTQLQSAQFPLAIPPPPGLAAAVQKLLDAIAVANKYNKESSFLDTLVDEGTKLNGQRDDVSSPSSSSSSSSSSSLSDDGTTPHLPKASHTELVHACMNMPPRIVIDVAEYVRRYSTEEVTENNLKALIRKITGGLHADFYPLLMEALGLGYSKSIMRTFVENCQNTRSQTIAEITKELEHIQAIINLINANNQENDGDSVSGSGMGVRRRSPRNDHLLKPDHCLQVTIKCILPDARQGLEIDPQEQGPHEQDQQELASSQLPDQAIDPHVHLHESIWNSPYKIFVDNVPKDVDSELLQHALRHCGGVERCQISALDSTSNFHTVGGSAVTGMGSMEQSNSYTDVLDALDRIKEKNNNKIAAAAAASATTSSLSSSDSPLSSTTTAPSSSSSTAIAASKQSRITASSLPQITDIASDSSTSEWTDNKDNSSNDDGDDMSSDMTLLTSSPSSSSKSSLSPSSSTSSSSSYLRDIKAELKFNRQLLASQFGILCGRSSDVTFRQTLRRNPLAVVASIQRKPPEKAVIKTTIRSDNTAFAVMKDAEAYQRATRDDMRIFGLCINGHQCRIRKVHHMKTLILESKANFTAKQIKEMLSFVLGPDSYTFHLTDSKDNISLHTRRSYDTLQASLQQYAAQEFPSHGHAWEAFEMLSAACANATTVAAKSIEEMMVAPSSADSDELPSSSSLQHVLTTPFEVQWSKSRWYWAVQKKAKEMFIDYEALDKKDKDNLAKSINTKSRQHGSTVSTKNKDSDQQGIDNGSNKKTKSHKKKRSSKKDNENVGKHDNKGDDSDSIQNQGKDIESDLGKTTPIVSTVDGNDTSLASDDDENNTPHDPNDSNQPRFSVQ